VSCSLLQCVAVSETRSGCWYHEQRAVYYRLRVAVCCSVLQCVAACCSELQCVAVSCSVL